MSTRRRDQKTTLWTPAEDAVLERHYPSGGAQACAPYLPGRTPNAIMVRASYIKIRGPRKQQLRGTAAAKDAKPARDLAGLPPRQRPALRKCLGPDCGHEFKSEHCGRRLCAACTASIAHGRLVDLPASLAPPGKSIGGAP